ncbi:MAG: hypothetical protein L3J20_09070 [Flavobacteriaceae bacterium]|nr:hypothetical protein [Flavobacteriaceae bacterium]
MHKKLEAELVSLAHSILQMKNRHEAVALKEKAREVYENLSVLAFLDDYVATTPNLETSKEELLKKIDQIVTKKEIPTNTVKEVSSELKQEEKIIPKKTENKDIFEPKFDSVKIDIGSLKRNQVSSKEEFRDTISADKTATLFEDDERKGNEKKTLNDKLVKNTIQVGLNDRIAFVKHLFNFDQSNFNSVLSQLNSFKTESEAKEFIHNKVKPDYDWTGKEEYEERLITLIERKFS